MTINILQNNLANILMSEEKSPYETDLQINAEVLSFAFYVYLTK